MTALPVRVQLRRGRTARGWRLRAAYPDAVTVRRPLKWGNPYPVEVYGREEAVRLYAEHLHRSPELMEAARRELRGKPLACWCRLDQICHADVLLVVANQEEE